MSLKLLSYHSSQACSSVCSLWEPDWYFGGRCHAVQWIGSDKAMMGTVWCENVNSIWSCSNSASVGGLDNYCACDGRYQRILDELILARSGGKSPRIRLPGLEVNDKYK